MSQLSHEAINMAEIPGLETTTGPPPQPEQAYPRFEDPEFLDSSGPLFSMYLKIAEEGDKEMTESQKGDADGILIVAALFSASVATLLSVSVQDLKPNSQDISAFYLANIYQILADSNGSQVLIPPTLPNPTTPFSPPTSAVWVNSLWFLSLVISLTCALLATLLQQWARRYRRVTRTRYSPHEQARIRTFFAVGAVKFRLLWVIDACPALLHLSLFLFFAGLAVFLFNMNHTIFKVAISWIGLCIWVYIYITFMPLFRHDSPYYSPVSSPTWYLYNTIRLMQSRILRWISNRWNLGYSIRERADNLQWRYWRRTLRGMEKEFQETAFSTPSEIDDHALMWTLKSLDEDHELEQFFSGIPGYCSSMLLLNPQTSHFGLRSWMVVGALYGFLRRTMSSNLVTEAIKIRRLAICIKAIDAARLSDAADGILNAFLEYWPEWFRYVELGHSLISWGNNDDQNTTLFAQGIIASVIANVPQRNERWFSLTMHQLGISEPVLQGYLNHGDSVLLANLIHFTRQFVRSSPEAGSERLPLSPIISRLGVGLNVQDTLPGLQHDFCDLWNEILQRSDRDHLSSILAAIHPIYLALHPGSTPHGQHQLCSIPGHRVDTASNLNAVNDGEMA